MDSTREPDTYIMLRVSFGDKPSAMIATVALRKTAEMSREIYPEAADIIQRNTYTRLEIMASNWAKEMSTSFQFFYGKMLLGHYHGDSGDHSGHLFCLTAGAW